MIATAQKSVQQRGKGKGHTMAGRKAAVLMAAMAVVAGLAAPIASARPTCRDASFKGVCATEGTVSFKAGQSTTPPPRGQSGLAVFPWMMATGGL